MKRRRNKSKIGLIFIVLLISLATLGASYSMWTSSIKIQATFTTLDDFNYLCLKGYWAFNETSGSIAYDSSMSSNDGTVHGATWAPLGVNGCLSFDGVNDFAEVADDNSLDITDKITVMGWVYIDDYENGRFYTVAGKWNDRDGNYRGYLLGLSLKETEKPQPRFYVSLDGSDFPSAISEVNLETATWYHLAGTYDGINLKIYVNGELKGTTAVSGLINSNNQPVLIGADRAGGGNGRFFTGFIDEVKIYSCVLSSASILAEYNSASP